jgi:hypothetical protein
VQSLLKTASGKCPDTLRALGRIVVGKLRFCKNHKSKIKVNKAHDTYN